MCITGSLWSFEADGWEKYRKVSTVLINYQISVGIFCPPTSGGQHWAHHGLVHQNVWENVDRETSHLARVGTLERSFPHTFWQRLQKQASQSMAFFLGAWKDPTDHQAFRGMILRCCTQISLCRSTRKTPPWETIYALIEVLSCFSWRRENFREWFNLCRCFPFLCFLSKEHFKTVGCKK